MTTVQRRLGHLEGNYGSYEKSDLLAETLALFDKYEDTWKTRKFSRAAHDLIAVSFSLRRAAFLADKTNTRLRTGGAICFSARTAPVGERLPQLRMHRDHAAAFLLGRVIAQLDDGVDLARRVENHVPGQIRDFAGTITRLRRGYRAWRAYERSHSILSFDSIFACRPAISSRAT
jgi:hypothetical protein